MALATKTSSSKVKSAELWKIQNNEQEGRDEKHKNERKNSASGWIIKFLKRPGHGWLEEVDHDYLNDFTNLMGLDDEICFMAQGLHAIQSNGLYLDSDGKSNIRSKTQGKYLDAAESLYGLVHARYLMTIKGLEKVYLKYKGGKYGKCPRHFCNGTSVLPIGMSDKIGEGKVKIYCPSCEDMYHSSLPGDYALDGAYFGTSLPQMFFMTYPAIHPSPTIGHYVPRLYGFKISASVEHLQPETKERKKIDKINAKSQGKRNRSKQKDKPTKQKTRDATKENDALQDNKLPQINGQVPSQKEKSIGYTRKALGLN